MPSPIPDPTRAELAALRAPDLSLVYERTLAHCRAIEHVGEEVLGVVSRALRYYTESALPDAGFELIRELRKDE